MRITPLQNISQQGQPATYPNMFQREEAPPPTPDKKMQPDMRNRVEAQTDTRHVVEYFNPTSRMETNSPNRTNTYHPTNIEMGRDPQRASGKQPEVDRTRDYQEILEWIREKQQLQEAREKAYREAREAIRREGEQKSETPREETIEDIRRQEELLERAREKSREMYDYYYRRGVEAYRQVQDMRQESRYSGAV